MTGAFRLCVAAAIAVALPLPALAINGMYLTGYGFESVMMGGADVAVARDAFAANNNPAGLTQTRGQAFDFDIANEQDFEIGHSDTFNDRKSRLDPLSGYFEGAYARDIRGTPYAAGVALVVQGGIGWTYHGMNVNPALGGGRDDASALFAIVKLAPALGWKVNDQLSLGATLGINYFAGSQELFPNTSCVACLGGGPFSGFRFKGASGIGVNGKLGLLYRPADDVTIGLTYGTRTGIPVKGGTLRSNLSNFGLGVVRYDDAELQGFHLPEEFAAGIAFRPTPSLLVSLQAKHYLWSKALKTLTIVATNPRTAGAPPMIAIPGAADFRDQDVLEIGAAYDWDEQTTLYGGFNYGSKAIPARNVNPIFAPITSRHLDLGISREISPEWNVAGGIEWFMPQTATYNSPIFGPAASDRSNCIVFHVATSRRW